MKSIDADYEENYLFPPRLEDWVHEKHPARFIREVVDALDFNELGLIDRDPNTRGRPPYSDRLLLRVWLYGYWEKIRSTRLLEKACVNHLGFIWLCGTHRPDHNTLWRFFNKNQVLLKKLFRQTVRMAMELDLVAGELQAVDGTKIQAACSGRGRFDQKKLTAMLKRLDQDIDQYTELINQTEAEAEVELELPAELKDKQVLREKVREALGLIKEGEAKHIHPDEPEARRMECDGRNRFGYNAQVVVDAQDQIIVAEGNNQ